MKQRDRIGNFQEFWPYYVSEHSKPGCRLLHFIGSSAGLLCLTAAALSGKLLFIPLGLIIGYGFAWIGHFFIEHNKPATFKYPLWSLIADWKMWRLMITGRMNNEVDRRSQT
ncbi:MAG: DUF962 domain-containing protein [Blastocatellia bacterium]|nr:DUF962 domain-containing protein [Blastocatellia bacterium]